MQWCCYPCGALLNCLTQRRTVPNRLLYIYRLSRYHFHQLHFQPTKLEMRTLRYLRYLPNQRSGHLQLDHLGCGFPLQPCIQPHHLLNRQSVLHRLLKRNAHSRRCQNGQRTLHVYHDGQKASFPVLQRQMQLRQHSVHGRSIHQQAQIISQQLGRCQCPCNVFGSWGCGYRRGCGRSCGRCVCELELCRGCYAVYRRRGGRAGVLRVEQWAGGKSGHVWLYCDASGRFLQLRVQELRSLISGRLSVLHFIYC